MFVHDVRIAEEFAFQVRIEARRGSFGNYVRSKEHSRFEATSTSDGMVLFVQL